MRIQATVNNTTRVYEDTDAVFGLLRMTKKDVDKASKCYSRIKKGEIVKLRYMGSSVYLRKIGD
jgi:hypothetical protein